MGTSSERTLLLSDEPFRRGRENDKERRSLTIVALSAAMLVQSFLLVGVFPYSGFMAMKLVPGLTKETAGGYAGIIACSFMVGRTAFSFEWGRISDKYGRVFAIRASLLLSAAFSLLFGLSTNFYMALVWRCLLGLSNGIVGPVKVLVTEFNKGDKHKETEMMGIVIGMWGLGFLINPAITGNLSDPVKQFPDSSLVQAFEPFLTAFPYFLPNLVGCIFCLIADALNSFVDETLPPEKRESFVAAFPWKDKMVNVFSYCKLFKDTQEVTTAEKAVSTAREIETLLPDSDDAEESPTENVTIGSLMKRDATREHLVVYWVYSFLIVGLEETFPLFCLSSASGLGIEEKSIGKIFSGSGLFFVVIQYFLLTGLVKKFGFYKTLVIGGSASIPLCFLIPLGLVTNQDVPEGALAPLTFILLSSVYAVVQVFSVLVISTLTMTTNRTVPPELRGAVQGLSMVGGSIAKAAGPAFSGIFFSASVGYFIPPTGSIVVFTFFSILGIALAAKMARLQKYETSIQ